jgi:hypothetical protein
MKPILHFQIPEYMMGSSHVMSMKTFMAAIKKRFSNDYELIISPWILQGNGAINIVITPETDIDEFMKKLESLSQIKNTENSDALYHVGIDYASTEHQPSQSYIVSKDARKAYILEKQETAK